MGVYIDMEMPQKTYAHCMLIKDIDGSVQLHVCTKNSEEISEWEFYDLVPVPPHGRLGDLDDIIKRAKKWLDHPDEYISQRNKDMIYILEREDAIIPASEEAE